MVLLSLTTSIAATRSTKTKPRRFVTKFIHRDSIFSPFYNPNATIVDRARQVQERSIVRLGYLARVSSFANTNDVRARIISADVDTIFLVKLSIGEPPVEQILGMDTGRNLIWVQCQPCTNCFKQYSPIYDRFKSSTYQNLTCDSPFCPKNSCDSFDHCGFSSAYVDPRTSASGIMGMDTFSGFFTSDEGIASIPYMIFGYAYDNKGIDGQVIGILGLSSISVFVSKFRKFSCCIGNIIDPKCFHNVISVGEKVLNIDRQVFEIDPKGKGGVLIDSGSTYSFLVEAASRPLMDEINRVKFCMAVRPSMPGLNGLNLVGAMAQQNYNVAYDLEEDKLTIQRTDCQLLE
ncbi:unnamed protein product [Dovyalis caffra]|uniref:Peptidase A1 domain-containing protein n=1 Tax=Dovyalis caffra TaxID=77055 RepID=A0AAV1SGJ6_9ROSI|nr:unnamed protein product [Dovyalis caffra]